VKNRFNHPSKSGILIVARPEIQISLYIALLSLQKSRYRNSDIDLKDRKKFLSGFVTEVVIEHLPARLAHRFGVDVPVSERGKLLVPRGVSYLIYIWRLSELMLGELSVTR